MIDSVVCFRWAPPPGYRSQFGPEAVNTLQRMVARHYGRPHRFVCVTDNTHGLDPRVDAVPLWDEFADVPSPQGPKNPSCYRRLFAFSRAVEGTFGRRFVMVDLDCVVTGDLVPVWDRPEDFVIWGGTHRTTFYNGSMVLMTAGARSQVWELFDPASSPQASARAGFFGSDQAWISYVLGPGEATWSRADGVYSFRNDIARLRPRGLPAGARIVMFHGRLDPWLPEIRAGYSFVREFYQ